MKSRATKEASCLCESSSNSRESSPDNPRDEQRRSRDARGGDVKFSVKGRFKLSLSLSLLFSVSVDDQIRLDVREIRTCRRTADRVSFVRRDWRWYEWIIDQREL